MSRERKPNGFYARMTDKQLNAYISERCKGMNISETVKAESKAYCEAQKRGLIDSLVKTGILARKKKGEGFYKSMTNEQLISYIKEHYARKTLGEFSEKGKGAYAIALKRGLTDRLVNEKVLTRQMKPFRFFADMTNSQLVDYVLERYEDMTITELDEKDNTAYNNARKRGLIQDLVQAGILVAKHNPKGFWKDMTDEQLASYIKQNYDKMTLSGLQRAEIVAYHELRRRKLIDKMVEKGILTRRFGKKTRVTKLLEDIAGGEGA